MGLSLKALLAALWLASGCAPVVGSQTSLQKRVDRYLMTKPFSEVVNNATVELALAGGHLRHSSDIRADFTVGSSRGTYLSLQPRDGVLVVRTVQIGVVGETGRAALESMREAVVTLPGVGARLEAEAAAAPASAIDPFATPPTAPARPAVRSRKPSQPSTHP